MADVTVKQVDGGRTVLDIVYSSQEQTRAGTPATEKLDVPFLDTNEEVADFVKRRVSEYLAAKGAAKPSQRVVSVDTSRVAAKVVDGVLDAEV